MERPYKGLQPYEPSDRDNFFGRGADCKILIDKILVNRLTLLFAASGVGKSSLLQAAVRPQLTDPRQENLSAVYCKDWVKTPLVNLRNEVFVTLEKQGRLQKGALQENLGELSLPKFFKICTLFTRSPLVVILDQFEEFFQYQRGTDDFETFIGQLSELITDPDVPVALVISMREDFALELNAFKPFLPTLLFENFYRLEKLTIEQAQAAIEEPVKHLGFRYEKIDKDGKKINLVDTLLEDLSALEQRRRGSTPVSERVKAVEPAYLQIVCKQLWEFEKDNPNRTLRLETYRVNGPAKRLLKNYVEREIGTFSRRDKQLASLAFNHLITRRGTKMAYTAEDLAEALGLNATTLDTLLNLLQKGRILTPSLRERVGSRLNSTIDTLKKKGLELFSNLFNLSPQRSKALEQWLGLEDKPLVKVLDRLQSSRILRRQQRDNEIWYELYHDLFSEPIDQWNETYKTEQRNRHALRLAAGAIVFGLVLYVAYDSVENLNNHHLRLSASDFNTIEIYQGKPSTFDFFGQQVYIAEIRYIRSQVEPHKRFERRLIENYDQLNLELIRYLPLVDSIEAYWRNGYVNRALELAEESINLDDRQRSQTMIDKLTGFYSLKTLESLEKRFKDPDSGLRSQAAQALVQLGSEQAVAPLIGLLQDQSWEVHYEAAQALVQLGSEQAVAPLIGLLQDQSSSIRSRAAEALGQLGSEQAVAPLIGLLKDQFSFVHYEAAQALVQLGSEQAVAPLIGLLKDQSSSIRSRAAQALVQLGSEQAVAPLIGLLKDQSWEVRSRAAQALGQLGSEQAVAPLIGLLKDQSWEVRYQAAQALGQLGSEQAVAPLIGLLKDQSWEVRYRAAQALGQLGNEQAVAPLIGLLKDQYWEVHSQAAQALVQLGSEQAVAPLIGLLKDQSWEVRSRAAQALVQLGSEQAVAPLIGLLKDQSWEVRSRAAQALGQLGSEQAVAPLIGLLKDQSWEVRSRAAQALGQLGSEQAVAPLIGLLKDQSWEVHSQAAQALGQLGSEQAVAPLIGLLKDQSWKVRSRAAQALGQLGSEQAVAPLIGLLQDQSSSIRSRAAQALVQLGSEQAVAPLIGLLKDQSSDVRSRAAQALVQLGSEQAVAPLIGLLKDQDSEVRSQAAQALGQLGSEQAVAPLIGLLKDQSWEVPWPAQALGSEQAVAPLIGLLQDQSSFMRSRAAQALGQLGSEQAVAPLIGLLQDQSSEVRSRAAQALGQLGSEQAVAPLIGLLKDQSSEVRSRAAQALGQLGSEQAVAPLIGLLKDQSWEVRSRAAQALGQLGSEQAVAPLIGLLKDQSWKVRSRAAQALGQLGSEQAVAPLIGLLQDQSSFMRSRAAQALGQLGSEQAVAPLIGLLKDQDSDVRKKVLLVLTNVGNEQAINAIAAVLDDVNQKHVIKLHSAAALLTLNREEGLVFLDEQSRSRNANYRKEIAEILGIFPSDRGTQLLLKLLDDKNLGVKVEAAKSIGQNKKASDTLPKLFPLLKNPNLRLQKAAATAIVKLAGTDNISDLQDAVLDSEINLVTRLTLLTALRNLGAEAAGEALLEVAKTDETTLAMHTINILGDLGVTEATESDYLPQKLEQLEDQYRTWRRHRDTRNDNFTEEEIDKWKEELDALQPEFDPAFTLAFAMARIDSAIGISLLSHDLADVRRGAWRGLGRIGTVPLLRDLHNKRLKSDDPIFRHAAYRAMDNILIHLEAHGEREDLDALSDFFKELKDFQKEEACVEAVRSRNAIRQDEACAAGVYTRTEWTVQQLDRILP